MDAPESPPGATPPRQADGGSAAVANTMVWTWKDINVVLVPLVGQRGVAALYNRSLYLTAKAFPWLTIVPADIEAPIDLDALEALLNQQGVAAATEGSAALLRTFHKLISTLIGQSLTERLLLPVWEKYSIASPAQEPLP